MMGNCCLFDLLAEGAFVLKLCLAINLTTGVWVTTFSVSSPVLITRFFSALYSTSVLCTFHLVAYLSSCAQSPNATVNHTELHLVHSLSVSFPLI